MRPYLEKKKKKKEKFFALPPQRKGLGDNLTSGEGGQPQNPVSHLLGSYRIWAQRVSRG
jgi:hypothetical protein